MAGDDIDEMTDKINQDLKSISLYSRFNQIIINESKSKAMIFTNKNANIAADNMPKFFISGKSIEIVKRFKFLGYEICSDNLIWKNHIKKYQYNLNLKSCIYVF